MGTPKAGTIQHPALSPIYSPRSTSSQLWRDWIKFISWLFGITLAFTVYNIGACALGRFLLDHFHLWDRNIPSDASELNKHAELLAALLASWLSTLAAIGVIIILVRYIDRWIRRIQRQYIGRRRRKFQFGDHYWTIVVVVLLSEWSLLPIAGAMLHPRFHYVDPVSLLGVYGFGNLALLPLSIPLGSFGWWAWRRRNRA
ncbi:hypothetical protein DL96DRAFT_1300887 [Flagelloscypha sp. PMI_526]|nr:hypothetical protein DL96DRAFT_1300887 [Flagelloscypha sp. PMI_526]